jgi:Flp pilus assembly protein TadD
VGATESSERALQVTGRYPLSLAWAGGVFALAGRRDAAQGIVTELKALADKTNSVAGPLAVVTCLLGNVDEALQWVDRAIDQRDPQVIGLKSTPLFENLRSDPRYSGLLQRMNLA